MYSPLSAKRKVCMAEKKQGEKVTETRYYWTSAKKHQLGNWVKEVRATSGMIVTPEQPWTIYDHILITHDPKLIKFVENHTSFKSGMVVPAKDLADAQLMTARLEGAKRATRQTVEHFEKDTPQQSTAELAKIATVVGGE